MSRYHASVGSESFPRSHCPSVPICARDARDVNLEDIYLRFARNPGAFLNFRYAQTTQTIHITSI